jgi:hypothetical protein
VVRRELGIAKHGIGVGGIGRGTNGALGIEQGLRGISGSYQQCGVVDEDGGIVRLKTKSALEILAGLSDIAVFEFKFPGDKIGGRRKFDIALALQAGDCVGIDLALSDEFADLGMA